MRSALLLLIAFVFPPHAMAIEEPPFEILRKADGYEIRRYPAHLVAEFRVRSSFEQAGNEAFRPLGDFIFGANAAAEKIGMTAPVTQRGAASDGPRGEQIGMTAPVTQRPGDDGSYLVQFVMPARYTLDTLPRPTDERIRIREEPAKIVAVHRYSGTWSEARYRKHEARLRTALRRDGLTPTGEPIWARFNSPFSLWFLRRNEIWLPVAFES